MAAVSMGRTADEGDATVAAPGPAPWWRTANGYEVYLRSLAAPLTGTVALRGAEAIVVRRVPAVGG